MNEEQFFAKAIQLPVAEREAFLQEACGSDVALRQRVERLLVAHESEDSLLEEAAPMDSTTDAVAAGRHPVIGNYKLLHKLGEGGFGVVYMAEQLLNQATRSPRTFGPGQTVRIQSSFRNLGKLMR